MTATQRWTLTVVCAATAMLMLDIAVVNTALSTIAADLDTGLSGLQWVVDAYTLTLAATVITAGSLADRFGRRRLFVVGLALFTATSLLCGVAQSITMLNVSRAAQGVGAAIMFAVSLAVLSHAFPRPARAHEGAGRLRRDDARGAFAIGPLVGGALTSGLGLALDLPDQPAARRWPACGSCGAASPSRRTRARRGWTVAGVLTLTGALFLLVFALLRGNDAGWASATILASFAGALGLGAVFVAVEARVAHPMLPLRPVPQPVVHAVRRSARSGSRPRCSRCGCT